MKKLLYVWAIASAVAMFVAGCGDDVINVKNEEVYAIVDSLADTACTKANEGAYAMVKGTKKLYSCTDGEWTPVAGSDAVNLRCQSEALKDSVGYNIVCDGEVIGTVYNGINGASGKSGKNGASCSMDTTKGVATVTCGDLKFTIKNGEGCSLDTAAEKITCGDETFDINLKGARVNIDSLKAVVVDTVVDHLEKQLDTAKSDIVKELKDSTSELRKMLDTIVVKQLEMSNDVEKISETIETILKDVAANGKSIKEIEERLAALEACRIVDFKIENSIQKVNVKCGGDESVLEMQVPNKNLSVVYKKHVIVRFPVDNDAEHTDYGKEQWAYLKSANYKDFAEFSILEVDSNTLNQTGKSFIAELVAKKNQKFVTIEEMNKNSIVFNVARLEGDIEVTNLISSYAQLHVSLDIAHNTKVDVAYNAYVNLDDADTIVIDFLTDYKGARVKELMGKNAELGFAAASAQANEELVSALHISEKAKDYPALEHHVPAEIGLNEQFASYIWPTALLDKPEKQNFNTLYADYRKSFAENGDFNTALTEIYNGDELSMYMIDFITLSMNDNFAKCWSNWFGSGCDQENWDNGALADVAKYKALQGGYKDAYKLGEIDVSKIKKDTIVEVKGGYFTFFRYIYTKKIWHPIFQEYIEDNTDDFGDVYVGACEGDNIGKEVPITFGDMNAILSCNPGSSTSTTWSFKTDGDALCKGKKEGSYIKSLYGGYYRCEKSKKEGEGIIGIDVDEVEFIEGVPCTKENAQGKLIEVPGDDNFYWCHDDVSGSDHDYYYRELDPYDVADYLDVVIPLQGGSKCDKANEGKTFVYNKTVTAKGNAICHDEHWVAQDKFVSLGICDENVMKQHKLVYVDKEEWNVATQTTWGYVKCDCEYSENDIGGTDYYDCEWTGASASEVEIMNKYPGKDMACDAERVDNKEFTDDGEYICKGNFDSRIWAAPTDQEKCEKNGIAPTPRYADEDASMRDNVVKYCVLGEGDNAQLYVKETGSSSWKTPASHLGSCSNNSNIKAKILMDGFKESQIYICKNGAWNEGSIDDIKQLLKENQNFDTEGKTAQCRANEYELLDANDANTPKAADGTPYKYRSTAYMRADGSEEANTLKTYVSHNKTDWYELDNALSTTTYKGSDNKYYLRQDGWCYDGHNSNTPTRKYGIKTDPEPFVFDVSNRIYGFHSYCEKGGELYVRPWITPNANGIAGFESAADYLGDCNAPDGQSYGAKILMEGYNQNRLYTCEKNGDDATWTGYAVYNEGVDALLGVVTDNNESDYAKLIRDVQCRMSYTMPSTPIKSYDGSEYKYQGSAKNRAGQTKNYVSYDKEDWFELNDANGNALLKDGWCYDDGNKINVYVEYFGNGCSEGFGPDPINRFCIYNGNQYYQTSISSDGATSNKTKWLDIKAYCAQKATIVGYAQNRYCGVSGQNNDTYCEFVADGKGDYYFDQEGISSVNQLYKCVNNVWTPVNDKTEERKAYCNSRLKIDYSDENAACTHDYVVEYCSQYGADGSCHVSAYNIELPEELQGDGAAQCSCTAYPTDNNVDWDFQGN